MIVVTVLTRRAERPTAFIGVRGDAGGTIQAGPCSRKLRAVADGSLSPDSRFAGPPLDLAMFDERERGYLESARVARLATADEDGRPNAVPVCFVLIDGTIVTPLDEKPKAVDHADLRRVRDVRENSTVALVVDHYAEDWSSLSWLQVRGTASVTDPEAPDHDVLVDALRSKYDQYAGHNLDAHDAIRIDPGSVVSWGDLGRDQPGD